MAELTISVLSVFTAGVLVLFFKLHRIGMTFGQFRAEMKPRRLDPSSYRDDTGTEARQ